jgi:hypothetical protein
MRPTPRVRERHRIKGACLGFGCGVCQTGHGRGPGCHQSRIPPGKPCTMQFERRGIHVRSRQFFSPHHDTAAGATDAKIGLPEQDQRKPGQATRCSGLAAFKPSHIPPSKNCMRSPEWPVFMYGPCTVHGKIYDVWPDVAMMVEVARKPEASKPAIL